MLGKKLKIQNVYVKQQLTRLQAKRSGTEMVTKGVYRFKLGRTNSYLVLHGSSVVLVDTGLPTHVHSIVGMLEELGLPVSALDLILLTHRHLDHSGSAEALRLWSGAPVVIHRSDADAVQGRQRLSPVRGPLGLALNPLVATLDRRVFRFQPCTEVLAVDDGWRHAEPELESFVLVHLPGHTPGHSGWYFEPGGVVFCGDAAMNVGNRLSGPSRVFSMEPRRVRRSQRRLAEMEADIYCFGHGPPLFRGAEALRRLSG
jgi:glyoxylase-like metal-dependent hydrolase (beta-lactamase superfamily II)